MNVPLINCMNIDEFFKAHEIENVNMVYYLKY